MTLLSKVRVFELGQMVDARMIWLAMIALPYDLKFKMREEV